MKNKKLLIILVICVVAAVIVAVVVGVNLNKNSEDDELIAQFIEDLDGRKGEDIVEEDDDMDRAIKGNGNSKLICYPTTSSDLSPNYSPRTHKIDTITIHMTGGQLPIETIGKIYRESKSQASSNYGIGPDGRIGMYVEEKNRSWSSSNAQNDNRAVTIEVSSDAYAPYKVNDATYESLIELVTDICKRNNIKKLVWSTDKNERINHLNGANMTVHSDFANKKCPGEYLYEHMGDIANKVNEKLGVK